MKLVGTAIATVLLTISVAEAKKSTVKKSTRQPASAVQAYCGVLARGTSGSGRLDADYIVDQTNDASKTYFNVSIPQDAEIGEIYAPRPGDSDPDSDSYVDHNFRIGGENVWLHYAGHYFTDSQVSHGKCICVVGTRSADTNSLNYMEGYALREGKCEGISQDAVDRLGRHQP